MNWCRFPGSERCGRVSGYVAGCRDDVCHHAASEYRNGYRGGYALAAFKPTPPWHHQAKCKGMDPNLFFAESGEPAREALAVCVTCPVKTECLEDNLGEKYGVWGGTTERERRKIRRSRRNNKNVAWTAGVDGRSYRPLVET